MSDRVPTYTHHRASGQALVRLNGHDHYLGTWKSAASRAEYDRLIAEWLASGRQLAVEPDAVTVLEIVGAFRKHARIYYRLPDGRISQEAENYDDAAKPLLKLYSRKPAAEFGPLRMKAVREEMVHLGWSRKYVNRQAGRIKAIFAWAVSNEMLPASVTHALREVRGLMPGRSDAPETEPIKPVPMADVTATLPHVSEQVKAMIQLQLLSGMRAGEVVRMRGMDIDTTGRVWIYRPPMHKGLHHGHTREIYLGRRCQDLVRPFLKPDVTAHLFDPREAERLRRQEQHAQRKTPLSCGNRPGKNQRRKPKRAPGDRYGVAAYRRAIARACEKAEVSPWHPHQLRHTAATELRKTHGLEVAQVILGHQTLTVTQVYAERNVKAAVEVMEQVG